MNSGRSINGLDTVVSGSTFSDVTTDLITLSINELDTVLAANRSPDNSTDLTTLCGKKNKYRKMVETLFRTEFGNVKLGDILLTSKDEFLQEYGKSPQTKSLLRGWIEEYNLTERFAKSENGERNNETLIEKIMPMVNFFENMKHTSKTRLNCWDKESSKSNSGGHDLNLKMT